mmetsp:Transcript_11477/g.26575  ORF Transcript_11477/g.26575 Transcript_11477/m.26575 type:complete len:241 (+) Transcript_11477:42-764(+)
MKLARVPKAYFFPCAIFAAAAWQGLTSFGWAAACRSFSQSTTFETSSLVGRVQKASRARDRFLLRQDSVTARALKWQRAQVTDAVKAAVASQMVLLSSGTFPDAAQAEVPESQAIAPPAAAGSKGGFMPNLFDLLQRLREEEDEVRREEEAVQKQIERSSGNGQSLIAQARLRNLDAVLRAERDAIIAEEKDAQRPGPEGKAAFEADADRLANLEYLEGQLRFDPEENKMLKLLEKLLPN